jgi:hypothetical protein
MRLQSINQRRKRKNKQKRCAKTMNPKKNETSRVSLAFFSSLQYFQDSFIPAKKKK